MKNKNNQKLNVRMTESVCYYVSAVDVAARTQGLVRRLSGEFGRGRLYEREGACGRRDDSWRRGQRAALTPAVEPLAHLFMIPSLSSRYSILHTPTITCFPLALRNSPRLMREVMIDIQLLLHCYTCVNNFLQSR